MNSNRQIIISLAPVGFWKGKGITPPLSPMAVAEGVRRCEDEGAALVHLHVRDEEGNATTDMGVFNDTAEGIHEKSSLILQGSTGGVEGLTPQERCVVLQNSNVEAASLNMGSTNFFDGVYVNSPQDIRYWADQMRDRNIVPELEAFTLTMIPSSIKLQHQGVLGSPLRFTVCMGIPWAIPLDVRFLYTAAQLMPPDAVWGILMHGRTDPQLVATALSLGASWIRVGFEDSPTDIYGRTATENAHLVKSLREYIELLGYSVADVKTARRILEIGC